jgi:hypothetical protein
VTVQHFQQTTQLVLQLWAQQRPVCLLPLLPLLLLLLLPKLLPKLLLQWLLL